jgi:putative lipoic acid-binding regulatory protein
MSGDLPHNPQWFSLSRLQALELLDKHHQFPGSYMFKAIGFNTEEFAEAVRKAAEAVLGPLESKGELRCRLSREKRYLAVTLEVEVEGANQVLEIYDALREVPGVISLA